MSLVDRAKNICLTPNTEWPVIAAEPVSPGPLVTGYVLPLAAIGAVAGFIGGSIVGTSLPFIGKNPEQWYIFRRIWPDGAPATEAAEPQSLSVQAG